MTRPPAREPPDDPRLRAREDLVWYLRHAGALARWPVLPEQWARRVEQQRREADGRGRPPTP